MDGGFLRHADPLLAWQVMREARLLYGGSTDFADLQCRAYAQYIDHKPYFEMERRFVNEHSGVQRNGH